MTLRLAYLSTLCGCFLPLVTRAAYAQATYTELNSGCPGSASGTCPSLNPNGGSLLLKASQGMHAFLVKGDVATIGGFELFMAAVSGPGVRLNTAIYKGTQLGGPKDPPVATGTMDVLATAGWYRTTLPATLKRGEDLFIAVELNLAVLLPMVLNGKTGAAWAKASSWQQLSPDEAGRGA